MQQQQQQQRRPQAAVECDYSSLPQDQVDDVTISAADDTSFTAIRHADGTVTATVSCCALPSCHRLLSVCVLLLMAVSALGLALYIGYRAGQATWRSGHGRDEPRWLSAPAMAVASGGRATSHVSAHASSTGRHALPASSSAVAASAASAPIAASSWCPPCECPCDAGPYIYQWHCGGRAPDGQDLLGEGIGGRLHHMKIATTIARMTNFTLILHSDCLRDGHHHTDLDTRLGIGRSSECDSCSLSRRDIVTLTDQQTKAELVLNTTRHTSCPVLSTADRAALLSSQPAAMNSSWFAPALLSSVYTAVAEMDGSSRSRAVFGFTRHPVIRPLSACTGDLFHSRYETRFRRQLAAGSRQPLPFEPGLFQLAVHFRWGDVSTGNTNEVTHRTGYSLPVFSHLVQRLVSLPELAGRTRVWLFSEGESGEFNSFLQLPLSNSSNCSLSSLSTLRLGENSSSAASDTWDDLDMMAHADVLVGGGSSFLLLAATLAGRQQLLIADASNEKLSDHETGFFTPRMQAVTKFDEQLFRQRVLASTAYARVHSALAAGGQDSSTVRESDGCMSLPRAA